MQNEEGGLKSLNYFFYFCGWADVKFDLWRMVKVVILKTDPGFIQIFGGLPDVTALQMFAFIDSCRCIPALTLTHTKQQFIYFNLPPLILDSQLQLKTLIWWFDRMMSTREYHLQISMKRSLFLLWNNNGKHWLPLIFSTRCLFFVVVVFLNFVILQLAGAFNLLKCTQACC